MGWAIVSHSFYSLPTALSPSSPLQPPSAAPPYPQPWVQVQSRVEQLVVIVILVLPLADDLVDGGGKANESCGGGPVLTPRLSGSQGPIPMPSPALGPLEHSMPHRSRPPLPWALCHSPPELRKRFPVPTSGYCSASPHSGQQKPSAEKSRWLPLCTNFFSSSEGLPARITS